MDNGSHQKFLALVARDAKEEATLEESASLRRPEMLTAWRLALGSLLAEIDAQLSSKKAQLNEKRQMLKERVEDGSISEQERRDTWHEFHADEGTKRLKTLWFKRSLRRKMAECKTLISQRNHSTVNHKES